MGGKDTAACQRRRKQQSSVMPGHGEGGWGRSLTVRETWLESGHGPQDAAYVHGRVTVGTGGTDLSSPLQPLPQCPFLSRWTNWFLS